MNNDEGLTSTTKREHNSDASAKRVVLRAQDPSDGAYYNLSAIDNGDGTHGLPTNSPNQATRLDDSSDPIIYVGKAAVGSSESSAVWQIAKLDTSSGLSKTWAGTAGFDQIWSDRGSLTYN